jgi:proline racemase
MIGDVIVGGVLPPAGATMYEKMRTMERDHDHVRRLLLCEPRGSVARHVNLIVPPTRPDCDAGVIIMEPTEYVPMSGSNTIATVTVLLETGMLPLREPETIVRLDMPGGLVTARAHCRAGQ